MISRLTTIATLFAVLSAASLAIAAEARQAAAAKAEAMPVVQMERVVITGKRLPAEQR